MQWLTVQLFCHPSQPIFFGLWQISTEIPSKEPPHSKNWFHATNWYFKDLLIMKLTYEFRKIKRWLKVIVVRPLASLELFIKKIIWLFKKISTDKQLMVFYWESLSRIVYLSVKTTIVDGGGVWGQRPHTTFWPPTWLVEKGPWNMIDCVVDGEISEDIPCGIRL